MLGAQFCDIRATVTIVRIRKLFCNVQKYHSIHILFRMSKKLMQIILFIKLDQSCLSLHFMDRLFWLLKLANLILIFTKIYQRTIHLVKCFLTVFMSDHRFMSCMILLLFIHIMKYFIYLSIHLFVFRDQSSCPLRTKHVSRDSQVREVSRIVL